MRKTYIRPQAYIYEVEAEELMSTVTASGYYDDDEYANISEQTEEEDGRYAQSFRVTLWGN